MKDHTGALNLPGGAEDLLAHSSWMRALARSLVLDDGEADDAVQETWLAALRTTGEVREPRAWLAGTLRRKLLLTRRAEGRRREHESRQTSEATVESPDAATSLQLLERQRALLDSVAALPEKQREAILARYYEGLSPREIARRDSLPVETVKDRLKRGLQKLRSDLDREHGDRAAWAGWLLPLASAPQTKLSGAAGFAVGATILVGLILGGFALIQFARSGTELVEGRSPVSVSVPSTFESEAPEPTGETVIDSSGQERTPVESVREPLRVVVLDREGGTPVPGALVAVLDEASIRAIQASAVQQYDGPEAWFLERGEWIEANTDGVALIRSSAPQLLRASSATGVAIAPVEGKMRELVVTLQPCIRLDLEVRDAGGELVDDIPIAATLRIDGTRPGMNPGAQERYTLRRQARDGRAWFQDPLDSTGVMARRPELSLSPVWTELRIDLPGIAESAPQARVSTLIAMKEVHRVIAPFSLVLPDTGSIELRILDSLRTSEDLTGEAVLRWGSGRSWSEISHRAAIDHGVAHWPRVALGQNYSIEISLSELGVQWTIEAAGPDAKGETRIVKTPRPDRPAITGRLVNSGGKPHRELELAIFHRVLGRTSKKQALRIQTSADGRFRFEWPKPAEVDGPIQLFYSRQGKGGAVEVNLPRSRLLGNVDLGEVELTVDSVPVLRGRCFDSKGEPLKGIHVSSRGYGHGFGTETDGRGRFKLRQLFGDEVEVEALDFKGRYPEKTVRLSRDEASQEITIVLAEGARVIGQLGRGSLPLDGAHRRVFLQSVVGEDFGDGVVGEDGSFEVFGLAAGRWRVSLRQFNTDLIELGELSLVEGEVREIEIPPLDRYLRRVDYRVAENTQGLEIRATVFGPLGDLGGTKSPGFLLAPMAGSWSVRFSARGRKSLVIEDVHDLEDGFELQLQPALKVTLLPLSEIPSGFRFVLEPEPGSAAEGELQTLLGEPAGKERVVVELGSPGRYRLVRRTGGGGARSGIAMIGKRKTTEVFEVQDSNQPQTITIDFAAPLLDE